MSWTFVFVLAGTAYGFKVLGLVLLGGRRLPAVVERCSALIPAALVAAIVIKDTVSVGQHLVVDARAAGVAAAVVAAWRKAPLIAIIVIGAAVTALVRQLG
ncbi:MAG: AzlD domain-containing protein [Ilumatobacteraceae bacterium]